MFTAIHPQRAEPIRLPFEPPPDRDTPTLRLLSTRHSRALAAALCCPMQVDLSLLPFVDQSFQRVLALEPFLNQPRVRQACREMARVLCAQGTLRLTATGLAQGSSADVVLARLAGAYEAVIPGPEEMHRALRLAGFRVVHQAFAPIDADDLAHDGFMAALERAVLHLEGLGYDRRAVHLGRFSVRAVLGG